MKAIKQIFGKLVVVCILALGLIINVHADSYYSAKDPDLPPLPFNKHPECAVVEVEKGIFVVDDTSIPDTPEQAESRKQRQEAVERARAIASDPILAQAAQQAAATTGVDNRNNAERVDIASPTPGRYRIVVTHSGGLTGGPSPSAQWVTVATSGDTPLPPVFTSIESNPSGTEMLVTFTADPGAYFHLLSSTDLASWQTNATVKAEGVTNAVLISATQPYEFYRLRRQQ